MDPLRRLGLTPAAGSLAASAEGRDPWLWPLALLAAGLYAGALFAPLATVRSLLVFDADLSIAGLLADLAREEEHLLLALVATFSVGFPVAKLWLIHTVHRTARAGTRGFERRMALLDRTAKWSMADVLVLAVAIVAVKADGLAAMASSWGLYLFLGFFAASSVALARTRRAAARWRGTAAPGRNSGLAAAPPE